MKSPTEEARDKARTEGSRSLTAEERALLKDYREPITKELRDQLRELESKSTRVVAWYAHSEEVRGPFHRWFTCSEVNPEYKNQVAWQSDDCQFAAAAMNNLLPLLDALDERDRYIEFLMKRDVLADAYVSLSAECERLKKENEDAKNSLALHKNVKKEEI